MAIGTAYLGLGLGGAISQKYVALPLIQSFGWRNALVLMGLSMLLAVPILLWVVRDRPADKGLFPDGADGPPPENAVPPQSFSALLRRREFWLLGLGSCASIGAIGSINQHMKLLFQDAGLPASAVANTTFLILMSSLTGRVVMGLARRPFQQKDDHATRLSVRRPAVAAAADHRPSGNSSHIRGGLRLRPGRGLYADPFNGGASVWAEFIGPRDGNHSAGGFDRVKRFVLSCSVFCATASAIIDSELDWRRCSDCWARWPSRCFLHKRKQRAKLRREKGAHPKILRHGPFLVILV